MCKIQKGVGVKRNAIFDFLPFAIGETVYYVCTKPMLKQSFTESGKIIGYQIRENNGELALGVDFKQKGNVPICNVSKDKELVDIMTLEINLRPQVKLLEENNLVKVDDLIDLLEKRVTDDKLIKNIISYVKSKYIAKKVKLVNVEEVLYAYLASKYTDNVRLSRYISLILRHKPEEVGLKLDENGWVMVDDLINAINTTNRSIDREKLEFIVNTDDKKRYSFDETKTKIRANQGHSVQVDVELKEVEPPEYLYHGTARKNIGSINKKGILANSRLYVHLSADYDTAYTVGTRHGEPVVLKINAKEMYKAGYKFYLSENKVWLTTRVPIEFLL